MVLVRLDMALHLWLDRRIRRTQHGPCAIPMRESYGPHMGILRVFNILWDPYGGRAGPLWTRKGIDTTRICKNLARVSYVAVRGPYGPRAVHGLFTIFKPVRGP